MHKQFLLAALEQAWLGRGRCAPNPAVGAVAVKNNKIIAQATHLGAGSAHAEQLLLKKLPPNIQDLVIYVTLEPCNHWGKTPPCVQEIITYGVSKVVYAYQDPNPIVCANNTPHLLKEKGIEVLFYPIDEITKFYNSYHYWTTTGLPYITAKIAQSIDGKIAGAKGKRIALSNDKCNEFTHKQRLATDAILTTSRTVNNDDPILNARIYNREESKTILILDRENSLKHNAKVLLNAKHCHIFHHERKKITTKLPNCTYYPVSVVEDKLNLKQIVLELGLMGFHDVWVEAGAKLFTNLHLQKLVNKTYIYIAPKILGYDAIQAYTNEDILQGFKTLNWNSLDNNMILSFDWNR